MMGSNLQKTEMMEYGMQLKASSTGNKLEVSKNKKMVTCKVCLMTCGCEIKEAHYVKKI